MNKLMFTLAIFLFSFSVFTPFAEANHNMSYMNSYGYNQANFYQFPADPVRPYNQPFYYPRYLGNYSNPYNQVNFYQFPADPVRPYNQPYYSEPYLVSYPSYNPGWNMGYIY